MAESSFQLPFTEQIALKNVGENEYESVYRPQRMGNPINIAYGGYTLGIACKAAYFSAPEGYHLYSLLGHYLGPAYNDRALHASVRVIRQTRTFATRQVEVSQVRDDGKKRVCLIAIADFQVAEKAVLLEYSRTPNNQYPNWKDCPTPQDTHDTILAETKLSRPFIEAQAKKSNFMPSVFDNIFDQRAILSGVFAQNFYGILKNKPHSQDNIPLAKRTTADWFRCRQELPTPADHMALLSFLIDSIISWAPLSFNHMFFDDVSAVSSLDFALRFFRNDVDMNKWHVREINSPVGSEGRTFGESWIWDEEGRAVACMSQQGILRPSLERKKKLEKL